MHEKLGLRLRLNSADLQDGVRESASVSWSMLDPRIWTLLPSQHSRVCATKSVWDEGLVLFVPHLNDSKEGIDTTASAINACDCDGNALSTNGKGKHRILGKTVIGSGQVQTHPTLRGGVEERTLSTPFQNVFVLPTALMLLVQRGSRTGTCLSGAPTPWSLRTPLI